MSNKIEPFNISINRENGGIIDSIELERPCYNCTNSYNDYYIDEKEHFRTDETEDCEEGTIIEYLEDDEKYKI